MIAHMQLSLLEEVAYFLNIKLNCFPEDMSVCYKIALLENGNLIDQL